MKVARHFDVSGSSSLRETRIVGECDGSSPRKGTCSPRCPFPEIRGNQPFDPSTQYVHVSEVTDSPRRNLLVQVMVVQFDSSSLVSLADEGNLIHVSNMQQLKGPEEEHHPRDKSLGVSVYCVVGEVWSTRPTRPMPEVQFTRCAECYGLFFISRVFQCYTSPTVMSNVRPPLSSRPAGRVEAKDGENAGRRNDSSVHRRRTSYAGTAPCAAPNLPKKRRCSRSSYGMCTAVVVGCGRPSSGT